MREKIIYLSGAITGIPEEEAYEWRNDIEGRIYNLNIPHVCVFNPVNHFDLDSVKNGEATDEEIMNVELYKLKNSTIVFYNCHYPKSLGSMAELAIAHDRGIPILAFNENDEELHPWIKSMCLKIFKTREEMLMFFLDHFLYED